MCFQYNFFPQTGHNETQLRWRTFRLAFKHCCLTYIVFCFHFVCLPSLLSKDGDWMAIISTSLLWYVLGWGTSAWRSLILIQLINPRPGRGGGWCHPPEVFLRCTPNYEADRAELLHSLWGILCATFGKKILTGSCQVTEIWRHKRYKVRPFLREIAEYGSLEGDIEASFDYFRSELTLWHRHHIF